MKKTEKAKLKHLARTAHGPFSYLTWKGFRFTVLRSEFTIDGELVIIEKEAKAYFQETFRLEALERAKGILNEIISITNRMSETELIILEEQLKELKNGINLHYERASLQRKDYENQES